MSDMHRNGSPEAETSHEQLPDPVDQFEVTVEKQDDGWAVIKIADGERSVINLHPDEESARTEAKSFHEAATRHEDGARVEDVPDSYPGKGVDETQ